MLSSNFQLCDTLCCAVRQIEITKLHLFVVPVHLGLCHWGVVVSDFDGEQLMWFDSGLMFKIGDPNEIMSVAMRVRPTSCKCQF